MQRDSISRSLNKYVYEKNYPRFSSSMEKYVCTSEREYFVMNK